MIFSPKFQRNILLLALCCAALTSILCMLLMTAEYDEAWVIASGRQAFDPAAVPQVPPVTTTGGLHFLLMGLSVAAGVDPIPFARILSLICMVLVMGVVYRGLGRWQESGTERLIVLVTCCAAPGTLLMAGMGYGVALAMLLFLSGVLVLIRQPRAGLSDALIAGVLIGLALATRWTFIPALPALLLLACHAGDNVKANLLHALLAMGVAVAVFLGFNLFQIALLAETGPEQDVSVATNAHAAGITASLPPPARLLSFLARFSATLPVVLVAIALVTYLDARAAGTLRRILLILAGAALLMTAAWVLRAPWMHLRYIWPTYFLISLCAGLGLAWLYRKGRDGDVPVLSTFAVTLPVLLIAAQLVLALRLIAVGAGMQVNAAGYDNLENHYKPLHLKAEERAIARFLHEQIPPEAVIGTVSLPWEHGALELSLLGQRVVHDFAIRPDAGLRPDYVITHRFAPFNDSGRAWLTSLGPPIAEISGYTIYSFPQGAQIPAAEDIVLDQQLYRFALSKWATLTGW